MNQAVGGCSAARPPGLTEPEESLVRHVVAETMRRVPPSVTNEELMAAGHAAALAARDNAGADLDGAVRAALAEALRAIDWPARGRRPATSAGPERVGAVRAALAALSGDRREVIEGYFLRARSLRELGEDLELDHEDVVELRDEALHALRRTLAPVLAGLARPTSRSVVTV